MITTTKCYLNTWKRFVHEGVLDSARLNKRVIESWYRCKQGEVNPYLTKGHYLLSNEQLQRQKVKYAQLLEVASSHLAHIDPILQQSGMMALVIDPEGVVLSIRGHRGTVYEAEKINFVEGACWTEDKVGTNAIGTALQTGEAVMINGTEHFSVASHRWSCSATPIYDQNKELLGIIDISCPLEQSHPLMLGTVTSIAYMIEQELNIVNHEQDISIFEQAIDFIEMNPDVPFVVCNDQGFIISASRIIREKNPQYSNMKIEDLLSSGYNIQKQKPILSKKQKKLGTCLLLSEAKVRQHRHFQIVRKEEEPFQFQGVIGTSEVFINTIEKAKLVSKTDSSVYILGETGTGKELIARAIHENSSRKNGPFIAVNCGAIPKALMESELFGYVEGAFTGAKRQGYKGKFEQANHGTLFLDEIGEMPPAMQVAILRVLQERKVIPIGGTKEVPIDIRIIAATHRDLFQLVTEGTFRQDLYYRLHVFPIHVPTLKERREDIPAFIHYFCQTNNCHLDLPVQLLEQLQSYDWPGNIRELMNILENLKISAGANSNSIVELLSLFKGNHHSNSDIETPVQVRKYNTREKIQREMMIEALQKTCGNASAAAKLLGIPRSTFYRRAKKLGLS